MFDDKALVSKIQKRLPQLFRIAELECSRAGKIGMQVGSMREAIIIALLIFKFGEPNVETDIPITEPEIDAKVFGYPVSIKTITGRGFSGVKLIWTVDAQSALEFQTSYTPSCDILFTQILWGGRGGLYYIPLEIQRELINKIGRERYIKLPTLGTNPRGAEITKEALQNLILDRETRVIEINWEKPTINYDSYKRWVDYWREQ